MRTLCPIVLFLMTFFSFPMTIPSEPASAMTYIAVVDAGSTGSRVFIYKRSPSGPLPSLVATTSVEPGLASLGTAGDVRGDVLRYLGPLIDCVRAHVPPAAASPAVLHFKATAGMRMLLVADQKKLMAAVRDALESSLRGHAVVASARVIPGAEEALLAYLAANSLLHEPALFSLSSPAPASLLLKGIVDLGGSSTQIAFPSLGLVRGRSVYYVHRDRGSDPLEVEAHSYLQLGLNQAHQMMLASLEDADQDPSTPFVSPCFGLGESHAHPVDSAALIAGLSNFDECLALVRAVLVPALQRARRGSRESPARLTPSKFIGYDNYVHVHRIFGVDAEASLAELHARARDACTGRDFHGLGAPAAKRAHACFAAAWVLSLLAEYGFDEAETGRIAHQDTFRDVQLSWTLGTAASVLAVWRSRLLDGSIDTRSQVALLSASGDEVALLPSGIWDTWALTTCVNLGLDKAGTPPEGGFSYAWREWVRDFAGTVASAEGCANTRNRLGPAKTEALRERILADLERHGHPQGFKRLCVLSHHDGDQEQDLKPTFCFGL